MKKTPKLTFHRETIKTLKAPQLTDVAGGGAALESSVVGDIRQTLTPTK